MNCPLCRLPIKFIGGITTAHDDVGQVFTFALCHNCQRRLERLPVVQRCKQYEVAISNLERHPERYDLRFFDSDDAARIYVALESERLQSLPAK